MRLLSGQFDSSKRRILVFSAISVVVLLAGLLALQYFSLVKLQKTSRDAQKLTRLLFLQTVAAKTSDEYLHRAQQLLTLPMPEPSAKDVNQIETHFREQYWKGAEFVFVAFFTHKKETQILIFDPAQNSFNPHFEWPVHVLEPVLAPWQLLSANGISPDRGKVRVNEVNAEHRILLVPILDKSSRVTGVTGMLADIGFFRNEFVPSIVRAYLPKYGSAQDKITLTLRSPFNQLLFSSDPTSRDDETSVPLPQVFTDWRLGLQGQGLSPEQSAGRNFVLNFSLALMMLVLLGGAVGLMLRGAMKEMKLSQMKSDFISNVSHELRTPLSSIRVFAEFLRLGWIDEPARIRETGGRIEAESQRLTQLIDNILDFSRIESGRKEYRFEKTSLDTVVQNALKIVEAPSQRANFKIDYENLTLNSPQCVIDRDAMTRALVNLIDNAVKYSRTSKNIVIKVDQNGDFATVSVIDHGIGIPLSDQQRIFEKFYRAGSSLVHDVKGTGLGLTIVKHIVDAHHGRITVDSKPGAGSTFTVFLPLNNGSVDRRPEEDLPTPSKPS